MDRIEELVQAEIKRKRAQQNLCECGGYPEFAKDHCEVEDALEAVLDAYRKSR